MTDFINARFDITATAIEPIHHGAGTVGNLSRLRRQEVITPEGELVELPFISGNSFRHAIRDGAVRFALQAMGSPGEFTKAVVDLLFSGGHLSKAGAAVDLTRARRMEELFPALSLLGYSAGNAMVESKLTVRNFHVACRENQHRMPETIRSMPHAALPAAHIRTMEFLTRHEATRSPHVSRLLTDGERKRLDLHASDKLEGRTDAKGDTSQMIANHDVIKAGAVLWGGLILHDVTRAELAALQGGLMYACEGQHPDGGLLFRLGAKAKQGYGLVSMKFTGQLRDLVRAPTFSDKEGLVPQHKEDHSTEVEAYVRRLRENREEILSFLKECMS